MEVKIMIHGAYTAIITPFKKGVVNYEKLGELIEFQIKNNTGWQTGAKSSRLALYPVLFFVFAMYCL